MEDLKDILPASLTALVAIITGWFAYTKWRREGQQQRSKDFEEERRSAYKTLWERIEALHTQIRHGRLSAREIFKEIQALNAEIFRLEPYLQADDHTLANEYVTHLQNLCAAVRDRGRDEDKVVLAATARLSKDSEMELLGHEWKMTSARIKLKERVTAALKMK